MASVLIGIAISFVFCLNCGIKYIIPVKEIIILIAFLSVKLIDEKRVDSLKELGYRQQKYLYK